MLLQNQRRKKIKQNRDAIERENKTRENGWNGRAGGLDLQRQKELPANGPKGKQCNTPQEALASPTDKSDQKIPHEGKIKYFI